MYSFKFQTCKCLLQGSKILVTWKNCIFEAALLLPYVVSEITLVSKSDRAHCKVAQGSKCSFNIFAVQTILLAMLPLCSLLMLETFYRFYEIPH